MFGAVECEKNGFYRQERVRVRCVMFLSVCSECRGSGGGTVKDRAAASAGSSQHSRSATHTIALGIQRSSELWVHTPLTVCEGKA